MPQLTHDFYLDHYEKTNPGLYKKLEESISLTAGDDGTVKVTIEGESVVYEDPDVEIDKILKIFAATERLDNGSSVKRRLFSKLGKSMLHPEHPTGIDSSRKLN